MDSASGSVFIRGRRDFLDGLVALGFLERKGDGPDGVYSNAADAAFFLDCNQPTYIGGILEMANDRLYGFWADLTEALRTGAPQNEIKTSGTAMFDEVYADPARLEQFMHAMAGISAGSIHALAERFDFSRYATLCDVGGGRLACCRGHLEPHDGVRDVQVDDQFAIASITCPLAPTHAHVQGAAR